MGDFKRWLILCCLHEHTYRPPKCPHSLIEGMNLCSSIKWWVGVVNLNPVERQRFWQFLKFPCCQMVFTRFLLWVSHIKSKHHSLLLQVIFVDVKVKFVTLQPDIHQTTSLLRALVNISCFPFIYCISAQRIGDTFPSDKTNKLQDNKLEARASKDTVRDRSVCVGVWVCMCMYSVPPGITDTGRDKDRLSITYRMHYQLTVSYHAGVQ